MGGRPALFSRIEQAPNLTGGLIETLVAQIECGQLAPGQRLPTEQAIVAATGVSRTVVREALASLRARGLITTRQGLGAFVADHTTRRSFTIDGADNTLADTLSVLELRMSIEVEAAGLAAGRRSAADLADIRRHFEVVSAAKGDAGAGADEDFAYHRAILAATQNAYFTRVFDVFGSHIIPRQRVRLEGMPDAELAAYKERLRREHLAILQAIEAADPAAARQAAHDHLARSRAYFSTRLEAGQ
ncbi:FadR/GntR family transcriptional regulator [Lichenicoccus sp.]|uniref:FadR/GntR family transcriptional regulator n=1 Tax=Lichenicoccus sp. TaxID=2781899 RepID=UPI003D0A84FE